MRNKKIKLGEHLEVEPTLWVLKRFNSFVIQSNNCMPWRGYIDKDGYGRFWVNGRSRLAHRVAYAMKHGCAKRNHDIHHTCFNRCCVNTDHLEQVSSVKHRRSK